MATILIVDDRPTNREYLITLLEYGGHRLLQAGDGAQGLEIAKRETPDLVVTDILMPTMDGFEFVRQLRADAAIASTPVIFFTAHYHEIEAKNLARSCGVSQVLTKPAEPQEVLAAVERALGNSPASPAPTEPEFDREHLQLLTNKLTERTDDLRRSNERLSALIELGLQFGSELDPRRLLQRFGHAARHILGARYAITAILENGHNDLKHLLTSGMDAATAARLGSPDPRAPVLVEAMTQGRVVCRRNPSGDPSALGLSSRYPAVYSLLVAPICSPTRTYGWLALIDKIGAEVFSSEDERLAGIIAAQVGRIYQNGSLYQDVLRHASDLESEIGERKRVEQQLRLQATALDAAANGIAITDVGGNAVWVNPAFARMTGFELEQIRGRNMRVLKSGRHDSDFYSRLWNTILSGNVWQGKMTNRRRDGSHYVEEMTITPVRAESNELSHFIAIKQDVTEREESEAALSEQLRLRGLSADVGQALTGSETLRGLLQQCAESIVQHLDAAFARIWRLNASEDVLELEASAGMYTHLDGGHSRIPVGKFKIGQIASERTPHLTNDVAKDPRVSDHDWARSQGIASFAGYPLLVDDRLVGVMGMFARQPLSSATLDALGSVASQIALGIERKQTERERDDLLMRLRMQIDRMPLAYVLFDQDFRVIDWNHSAERIFGYAKEEVLGMGPPFSKIVSNPSFEESKPILDRLRSGDMHANAVNENLTKAGRIITCEWSNTPLMDADGRFSGLISLAQDVTERKQAEAALLASEERIRLLLDSTAEAIYGLDHEGRCTLANESCARMLGLDDPTRLIGQNMHELIHHTRPDGTPYPNESCPIQFALKKGIAAHNDEDVFWRDDRTSFPAEYWSHPIRREGKVEGAVVTFLDISERKQLEEQYRDAERRLEHVVTSSPSVLFTLEVEGRDLRPTWISANIKALLNFDVAEVFRPNWWQEHVHEEDLSRVLESVEKNLFSQEYCRDEYRFRRRDGDYRWINSEMRLLRDKAGNPLEVVGSWSDITDRRSLEEQFRQAQKMEAVGRLAGGVAHDFNNILTVINGYSELVCNEFREGDPIREMVTEILHAGERAAGLTRQLLAFSRKQTLVLERLELNVIIANVEKMLRRLIGEDISLKFAPASDLWSIKADAGQVEQIIVNLVVNARDAMPHGGMLTIETHNTVLDETYQATHAYVVPGRYVMLAITDSGHGMDKATLARIFEPFFSTKGERGTGLGLATVYGIVKQCGGHVNVYSEPGMGTTFKIYFPQDADEARTTMTATAGDERSLHGTETIVLAEDADPVRQLSARILKKYGYEVLEARNGGEALLLCENFPDPIHLLISDVVMPQMSGPQLAERVKQIRPDIKVLYLSGYTDEALSHHQILTAGTSFLHKPFQAEALAAKVRDLLKGG